MYAVRVIDSASPFQRTQSQGSRSKYSQPRSGADQRVVLARSEATLFADAGENSSEASFDLGDTQPENYSGIDGQDNLQKKSFGSQREQ